MDGRFLILAVVEDRELKSSRDLPQRGDQDDR